ncbi:MAG: response regulator, partial [Prolixibacteraceae bacterium]|nr:response regulator [Prolixibacteraceae bacterium]
IKSDREKIYGVLSNLITNAIKYTPDGSIEIRCSKKGDNIELSVKDTGMGIPADKQKTIFERFAQPEIKDREAYEGWGLGLFITKAYLDLLGGKIWMESDEGRGSQFYFLIPANREKVKSIIKKTEKKPLTQIMNISKKLKVLIAEDDQSADYYLSILMEELNFEIFHAKTGLEALETCRKMDGLDLILMDIKMPVMDGYNTTKQIRKFNNEVVIVAQTAYALIGDREKAIEAGCDDYISKPLNKVELFEIIAKHFNNS